MNRNKLLFKELIERFPLAVQKIVERLRSKLVDSLSANSPTEGINDATLRESASRFEKVTFIKEELRSLYHDYKELFSNFQNSDKLSKHLVKFMSLWTKFQALKITYETEVLSDAMNSNDLQGSEDLTELLKTTKLDKIFVAMDKFICSSNIYNNVICKLDDSIALRDKIVHAMMQDMNVENSDSATKAIITVEGLHEFAAKNTEFSNQIIANIQSNMSAISGIVDLLNNNSKKIDGIKLFEIINFLNLINTKYALYKDFFVKVMIGSNFDQQDLIARLNDSFSSSQYSQNLGIVEFSKMIESQQNSIDQAISKLPEGFASIFEQLNSFEKLSSELHSILNAKLAGNKVDEKGLDVIRDLIPQSSSAFVMLAVFFSSVVGADLLMPQTTHAAQVEYPASDLGSMINNNIGNVTDAVLSTGSVKYILQSLGATQEDISVANRAVLYQELTGKTGYKGSEAQNKELYSLIRAKLTQGNSDSKLDLKVNVPQEYTKGTPKQDLTKADFVSSSTTAQSKIESKSPDMSLVGVEDFTKYGSASGFIRYMTTNPSAFQNLSDSEKSSLLNDLALNVGKVLYRNSYSEVEKSTLMSDYLSFLSSVSKEKSPRYKSKGYDEYMQSKKSQLLNSYVTALAGQKGMNIAQIDKLNEEGFKFSKTTTFHTQVAQKPQIDASKKPIQNGSESMLTPAGAGGTLKAGNIQVTATANTKSLDNKTGITAPNFGGLTSGGNSKKSDDPFKKSNEKETVFTENGSVDGGQLEATYTGGQNYRIGVGVEGMTVDKHSFVVLKGFYKQLFSILSENDAGIYLLVDKSIGDYFQNIELGTVFVLGQKAKVKLSVQDLRKIKTLSESGLTKDFVGHKQAIGLEYDYMVNGKFLKSLGAAVAYSITDNKHLAFLGFEQSANGELFQKDWFWLGYEQLKAGLKVGVEPWKDAAIRVGSGITHDEPNRDLKHKDLRGRKMKADDVSGETKMYVDLTLSQLLFEDKGKLDIKASFPELFGKDGKFKVGATYRHYVAQGLSVGAFGEFSKGSRGEKDDVRVGLGFTYEFGGPDKHTKLFPDSDKDKSRTKGSDGVEKERIKLGFDDLGTHSQFDQDLHGKSYVKKTKINSRPVCMGIPNYTGNESSSINYNVSAFFTDAERDVLRFTASGLPSGVTISDSGLISGVLPNVNQETTYSVTVTGTDSFGLSTSASFQLLITEGVPTPPIVKPAPKIEVQKGDNLYIQMSQYFETTNGDGFLEFKLISGSFPAGVSLNTTTGVISGIIGSNTVYNPSIIARDKDGWSDPVTLTIEVDHGPDPETQVPPTLNNISDQTGTVGTAFSIDLASFATKTNGDDITGAEITSGTLPAGLTLSGTTISGTPTTAGGAVAITVRVQDNDGWSNTKTFNITINAGGGGEVPPTMGNVPDQTGTVGTAFSLNLASYVTQTNGDAITAYEITSGTLPTGLSLNGSTGVISGTPTTAGGAVTITVRAQDNDGWSGTDSFTITINAGGGGEVPPTMGNVPDQTGTVGTAFSLNLASYVTQTNGDAITAYEITSGTLPTGLSLNGSTGVISGTPTTAGGAVTITVRAQDNDGWSGTDSFTITINAGGGGEVPPTMATIPSQTGTVGTAFSLNLASYVTQTNGDAIISYRTGGLPGGLSLNTTTGEISGTPNTAGTNNISVSATDNDGESNVVTFSMTINASAGSVPTWNAVPDQNLTVGTPFTLNLGDYVNQTDGDAITSYIHVSGTIPTGLSFNSTTGVISGTPTTSASQYAITFRAVDKDGQSLAKSILFTISAAAPSSAPTGLDLASGNDTGPSNSDNYTNNSSVTISWNSVSGATSYDISTNGGGSWTSLGNVTSTSVSLSSGANDIQVRAKNAGGTGPASSSLTVTLDTSAPTGLSWSGTTPNTKNTTYNNLTLTTSENLVGGQLNDINSSNGGSLTPHGIDGSGNIRFTWTTPNAGGSQITVDVVDKAGNPSSLAINVSLPNG